MDKFYHNFNSPKTSSLFGVLVITLFRSVFSNLHGAL